MEEAHQGKNQSKTNANHKKSVEELIVRTLPYFSRGDDGPRKSNLVEENDGLKQKKKIKVKQFPFQVIASFFFRRSMNKIQFLFDKDLFLNIKRSRILLDQEINS